MPARTSLWRAALLVLLVHVLHDLDHLRQGDRVSGEVVGTAVFGWLALAVLLGLVARGHRYAPAYAAGFGVLTAVGFVLVHLLPRWSAFSASYVEAGADPLSWVLAVLPIAAGLLLTARAVRTLRAPGAPATA